MTIFFCVGAVMNGGNLFASVAGMMFDVAEYTCKKLGLIEIVSEMTKHLLTVSLTSHSRKLIRKNPVCYYSRRPRKCHPRLSNPHQTSKKVSFVARKRVKKGFNVKVILALTTIPLIINAKASSMQGAHAQAMGFDTDSFPIAIDSGSTYCLSDTRSDFEGALTRVNVSIQGITDKRSVSKWKGTVLWKVLDDQGQQHVFKIPNTLLVETPLPFRILSPQHLSQQNQLNKTDTIKNGTRTIIGDGVHTGINTSIYPGRKLGPGTSTRPGEIVQHDLHL